MLTSKRTRLNVKQSKNGCFTCRARKKKCDETKPSCLQCQKAGRVCEGYHASASLEERANDISQPLLQVRVLSDRLRTTPDQSRFTRLGLEVLAPEAGSASFGLCNFVWEYMLPQISTNSNLVSTALAALGCTYEAVVLEAGQKSGTLIYTANVQYNKALAALRKEASAQNPECTPLFLTCVVLAGVEVLMRHLYNALQHLRGAFAIVTQYSGISSTTKFMKRRHIQGDCGGLYLLAQALDLQTSSYALSRPMDLPIAPYDAGGNLSEFQLEPLTPEQAHLKYIPLLHACYHFTVGASEYKYVVHSKIPPNILHQLDGYLARLTRCLLSLQRLLALAPIERKAENAFAPSISMPLLVLKVQCLSILVYLSTILTPQEIGYDAYIQYFEQIIDGAAIVLEQDDQGAWNNGAAGRFRIMSPLAQPLYLTAMKCRHGTIRRRAIELLSMTGREGPWDGDLFARIAQQAVEIEESGLRDDVTASAIDSASQGAMAIPEAIRLHGCGVESDQSSASGGGFVTLQLSQCIDVERMSKRTDLPWDAAENWKMWTEKMSI